MEKAVESYLYIVDAWKQHVQEDPNGIVLSDSLGNDYRRSEADDLSDRVHSFLKRNNVGKNDVVLLNLERSVKPLIAMIGVMKAGAAFTIVEAGYAKERVDFIRQDCNTKFELNEDNWGEAISCDPIRGYEKADDHDLAFCVYTSGTSGTPKGVMHEYGQYKVEMLSETQKDGSLRENRTTRAALVAPLNFVASLKIFVHVLYNGLHIFVMDYNTVKNPVKLTAYLLRHRINETFLSPSLLRLKGKEMGPFMKAIYTGAEPANNVYVKNVPLLNTYTMSESLFTVCEFVITKPYSIAPIGNPLFDLDIRLLDENGNEVAPGETGEMCFYNPYCRGYINLPQENEKHFIDGYFHTGDLAAYTDGQYVLKGRNDDMIKIDGNRIEPSEIESACRKALGLTWCAAKGFEKEGVVALYYTDKVEINEEEARKKLETKLPYYMIPSYFIHVDKIPLTASGKLDRKGFTLPIAALLAEYVAPRNEFEKKLVEVMASVLELERIGIKDDFFKLGGNSIRAMEVIEKLRMEGLNVNLFYRGRTVEKISDLYSSETDHMSDEEKEMIGRTKRFPLPFLSQYIWSYVNNGTHDFTVAYQLSPLISLKKLRDTLNSYMEINSTFNVILEEEAPGRSVQVFNPNPPKIEIENMTEDEVKALQKTFIQPFKHGEPLYRIRLIRTRLHKYMFFDMNHIVSDGSGMFLMLQDIITLYKGGYVRPAQYFAYAYDAATPLSEEFLKAAGEYYDNKFDHKHRMRNFIKDETGNEGSGIAREISFPENKIDKLVSKYNSTNTGFIHMVVALAQEHYNGRPSFGMNALENRSPNENIAGMHTRAGCFGITTPSKSLLDLFEDMNVQQYNNIRFANYDMSTHVVRDDEYSSLSISYIGHWFDPSKQSMNFGKQIKLENHVPTGANRPALHIQIRHENGKMIFRFDYDRKYLSEEHAEHIMSLMEFAGNELLEGRYPQFPQDDEN